MKRILIKNFYLSWLFAGGIFSFTSSAQIIYTDIKDITYTCDKKCRNLNGSPCYVYSCSETYALDLNNDGTTDFNINTGREVRNWDGGDGNYCCTSEFSNWVSIRALNDNSVVVAPGSAAMAGSDISSVSAWSTGVSGNFNLSSVSRSCQFDYSGQCGKIRSEGDWPNSTDRYLGLKIILNGQIHYGWARLSVVVDNGKALFKIKDYAYERTPGRPINAGQMGPGVAKTANTSSSEKQPGLIKLLVLPNPFSTSATVIFSVPGKEKVSINVYTMTGQIVKEIVDKEFNKGIYQITLNAKGLSGGTYIIHMQTPYSIETEKLVVVK